MLPAACASSTARFGTERSSSTLAGLSACSAAKSSSGISGPAMARIGRRDPPGGHGGAGGGARGAALGGQLPFFERGPPAAPAARRDDDVLAAAVTVDAVGAGDEAGVVDRHAERLGRLERLLQAG